MGANQFQGQALSWQVQSGLIELALHREPCNELGSSSLLELEKFASALDELEKRHRVPHADIWETMAFHCRKLAQDVYLLTYTLLQDGVRRTRRSTIWQRTAEGWKIVIHTTRGHEEVGEYLRSNHIPHDEINSNSDYRTQGPKPVADVYWDDRAVCYSGDARSDIDRIRSFRTWSGRE